MKEAMKEELIHFLNRVKEQELLKIYEKDNQEIHELIDNVYKCAFRFNLTDKQTVYLLKESLKPFIDWIEK